MAQAKSGFAWLSTCDKNDLLMVIVFDGVCNICNRWVRFLLPRDPAGMFRFAHCQSEYGSALLQRLGEVPDDPSTIVLVKGEQLYLRSSAILRALASLGGAWRAMLLFLLIPRPVRDAAYIFFARRRYRWFGRSDHCEIPDPRWRERFLT
jgi:predicted DCC family thiol-disulfide oxidoreductase YuxK